MELGYKREDLFFSKAGFGGGLGLALIWGLVGGAGFPARAK